MHNSKWCLAITAAACVLSVNVLLTADEYEELGPPTPPTVQVQSTNVATSPSTNVARQKTEPVRLNLGTKPSFRGGLNSVLLNRNTQSRPSTPLIRRTSSETLSAPQAPAPLPVGLDSAPLSTSPAARRQIASPASVTPPQPVSPEIRQPVQAARTLRTPAIAPQTTSRPMLATRQTVAQQATPAVAQSEVSPASYDGGFIQSPSIPATSPMSSYATYPSADSSYAQTTTCCCEAHCNCGKYVPALGSSVNAWMDSQIYNGNKARQVLYHYDFENAPNVDRSQLNLAGRKKLFRLTRLLESSGEPIIIQTVDNEPGLAESRRSHVVGFLQSTLGIQISDSQVIVGEPFYKGVRGVEALVIDQNQLQVTRAYGISSGGGQSSNTNSGGQSGSNIR